MFRKIKWLYQRLTRGYSDRDLWNLNDFIIKILRDSVRDFRKVNTNSYPSCFTSYEEWQKVLEEMETCFNEGSKDIGFLTDEKGRWDSDLYEKQVGRKNEMRNKGFDLLKEYFDGLWD